MTNEILKTFPKIKMSILPTPIQRLKNLSLELVINIYCKRDDLTGFAFSGNKTRKLDFLIADALKKKSDTLVAIGANQSNFCRIASAAATVNGLSIHLVLGGKKPEKPTGNLLLSHLFGAVVHHIETECWDTLVTESENLVKDLEKQGKKVYLLPMGGSTPIGALGYVDAFLEIMEDMKNNSIKYDTIIHASASGGTQSGLVVGKAITEWPGKIIGMGVAKNQEVLKKQILEISKETGRQLNIKINEKDIIIDSSYMGSQYRDKTERCNRAIMMFAQKEGILLDSVYTGKAAAGLIDYAEKGVFNKNENVLFIHTGGNIQLFE